MKITKARLKEIIQEEIEREVAQAPGEPDYSVSGAEAMATDIARSQESRGFDAARYAALKEELLELYRQEREEGPSRGLGNVIDALQAEIDEIKRTHDLDA